MFELSKVWDKDDLLSVILLLEVEVEVEVEVVLLLVCWVVELINWQFWLQFDELLSHSSPSSICIIPSFFFFYF